MKRNVVSGLDNLAEPVMENFRGIRLKAELGTP
jgi:hypothetical protein